MHLPGDNDLAHRYFACVGQRDLDALTAFFVSDAMLWLPDGRELSGVDAIRAMYAHLFATQAPTPSVLHVIVGPHGLAVEYEVRLSEVAARHLAAFFYLNGEGRIVRLNLYARR